MQHLLDSLTDSNIDRNSHYGTVALRVRTTARLMATELALSRFRAERGDYPGSLDELVPGMLHAVPRDLFGTGPLKYRRAGAGYVLYSVGVDGVDDHGKFANPDEWYGKLGYDFALPQPRQLRVPLAPISAP